jgi:glycosyltransferase involved in cell wall biosynthesis
MKMAIVYDWIDKWGGVERLLLVLKQAFPEAHWYTSYIDRDKALWASHFDISTTFIDRLPSFFKRNRILSLPLYGIAFESLDLSAYEVVISVTSAFAKAVITKPGTKHISYILTPPRYLWGMTDMYLSQKKQILLSPLLESLRQEDFVYAQRPDRLVTLSYEVQKRIHHYYRRTSEVLYPPFNSDYWDNNIKNQKKPLTLPFNEYYLVVSRLEPYKLVDKVLEAFYGFNKNLVVVGTGSLKNSLLHYKASNIAFLDHVTDEELSYLYSNAKALIMPQIEDFGYVSLESQYHDCPVVAYARGGALETVLDDVTGILIEEVTVDSLRAQVARIEITSYNMKDQLTKQKKSFFNKFSTEKFIKNLNTVIKS